MASQPNRICMADSSFSRHLSQVGSCSILVWNGIHLGDKCPINSPISHHNWSLLNFNRSFVLLAEGPDINPLACLSPVVDSHLFYMISVRPVPDRFLGNCNWDAASWFRSRERMFRSCSCQLICPFITKNTLMTWHPYQLNSVMFGQLYEGLVAVADKFEVIWCLPSALIVAWLSDRI
jgi:hypothetical protein